MESCGVSCYPQKSTATLRSIKGTRVFITFSKWWENSLVHVYVSYQDSYILITSPPPPPTSKQQNNSNNNDANLSEFSYNPRPRTLLVGIDLSINPFAPRDFAEKRVLKLVFVTMKPLAANSGPPGSLSRVNSLLLWRGRKELEVDQRLWATMFCIELDYDLVTCMFLYVTREIVTEFIS